MDGCSIILILILMLILIIILIIMLIIILILILIIILVLILIIILIIILILIEGLDALVQIFLEVLVPPVCNITAYTKMFVHSVRISCAGINN